MSISVAYVDRLCIVCEIQTMEFCPKYWLDVEIAQPFVEGLERFISPAEANLLDRKRHEGELD